MNSSNSSENDFLTNLTELIEKNLTNSQFGVSWLARELGMSRSNLHRKVILNAKITVSQFINQVRLKSAMEMLRHTSFKVNEVAHQTGFSNTSYFIKCFHQYYGYTPGEVGKREEDESNSIPIQTNKKRLTKILVSVISVVVLVAVLIVIIKPFSFQQKELEKTIAILPSYYEAQDVSYSSVINGTVQNIIDNLNLIKDIEVRPWLSVVQYKNSNKPASEIAKDLNVNYVVKPSILTYDGKILLNIILIEGLKDIQIWTDSYDIDTTDVTTIYQKISKEIAGQINAQITPAEQDKIDKRITSNSKALNYYLEGVEFLNLKRIGTGTNNLEKAKTQFEMALELDNKCASAYAQLALIYYFIDNRWISENILNKEAEKIFSKQINKYADKALRYDSQLDLSLIAKALYYQNEKDYEEAIPYLEDALEYNPNSHIVISYLSNIYRELGDNEKFIKYALKTINSNFLVSDISGEVSKAYIYCRMGVAFRAMGFFDKALIYLNTAIEINPHYVGAIHEKSQLVLDSDGDYKQSKELLMDLIQMDSSNQVMSGQVTYKFLGLSCYIMRDYTSANIYYKKMLELIDSNNEDYSGRESGRLAVVFSGIGEKEKAKEHINKYVEFAESRDNPKNKSLHLIGSYSLKGEAVKAIEQMKIFSEYNPNYFHIRLFKDAPIYDNIRDLPEFHEILSEMEIKWQARHDSIKASFEEKGLL
ncbi:MAG: helix-turn-helix domain-containing protein [Bacteroidetes bacterium]|nr:helix-turn-helix domain-containing protein [Bacteroidota bacterium]